jgi:hypothetical protein
MRLFHRTPSSAQILHEGFRDGSGTYGTGSEHSGVRFSDQPIKPQPGAILVIDMPDEVAAEYEFDRGEQFRRQWKWKEFLIPAEVANKYGPARLFDELTNLLGSGLD